jgi:hypothetical protein
MRRHPTLQIIYLIAVGIALYITTYPGVIAAILALQVLLWMLTRRPMWGLMRAAKRLFVFFLFLTLSYAFFPSSVIGDRVPLLGSWLQGSWLQVSPTGLVAGLTMSARILALTYASMLIQQIDRKTLVQGLVGLGIPSFLAYAMDNTLALLTPGEQKHGKEEVTRDGIAAVLKRLVTGDVGFLPEIIEGSLTRARGRAEHYVTDLQSKQQVSDLAVISGFAFMSMSLKFVKVMPGLPIAPGFKGIVLIPLYILASELTFSRWGATKTGVMIGIVGFLMGDGKFGIFEPFRCIAPGIVVDLTMPIIHRAFQWSGPFAYACLGVGAAVARLSTIFLAALFVEAPPAFYTLLVPIGVAHVCFGFVSGFVTFHLLRSMGKFKLSLEEKKDEKADRSSDTINSSAVRMESGIREVLVESPSDRRNWGCGTWRWNIRQV